MSQQKLEAKVTVKDKLTNDPDSQLAVNLKFDSLKDFTPGQIAHQVPELAKSWNCVRRSCRSRGDLNKADFRKEDRVHGGGPGDARKAHGRPGQRRLTPAHPIFPDDRTGTQEVGNGRRDGRTAAGAQAPAAADASFDLLDELAGSMSVKPGEEGHEVASTGLRELMRQLLGRPA